MNRYAIVMLTGLATGMFLCLGVFGQQPTSAPTTSPTSLPALNITISKETTYVLGPVNADGTIDYVAAANKINSAGVNAKNNAGVLFLQALGPALYRSWHSSDDKFYKVACDITGAAPVTTKDAFVTLEDFVKELPADQKPKPLTEDEEKQLDLLSEQQLKLEISGKDDSAILDKMAPLQARKPEEISWRTMDAITSRPWKVKDFPIAAQWLKANKQPLATLIGARKLEKCFLPVISLEKPTNLLAAQSPNGKLLRDACAALIADAMLKAGSGDVAGAWAELNAVQEVAAAYGCAEMLRCLVAVASETQACEAQQTIVRQGLVTPDLARKFLGEMQSLPAMPAFDKAFDSSERLMVLDAVMQTARATVTDDDIPFLKGSKDNKKYKTFVVDAFDWNAILRRENTLQDYMSTIFSTPQSPKAAQARAALDAEIATIEGRGKTAKKRIAQILDEVLSAKPEDRIRVKSKIRQEMTDAIGDLLIATTQGSFGKVQRLADKALVHRDLLRISLALVLYEGQNKDYPKSLNDLVPKYLKIVPKDIFSGQDLHYTSDGKSYSLYSVGIDSKDDGGKKDDIRTTASQPAK